MADIIIGLVGIGIVICFFEAVARWLSSTGLPGENATPIVPSPAVVSEPQPLLDDERGAREVGAAWGGRERR